MASAFPGRPRLGLGLPAGLGCVPGLGTRRSGGAGRGAALAPPLAPPSSPPLPFRRPLKCIPDVLWLPGARRPAGRCASPFVRAPPPPGPAPPRSSRENRLELDVTRPRDFMSLLARWPEPETALFWPIPGTLELEESTGSPLLHQEPRSTYCVSTQQLGTKAYCVFI